MPAEPKIIEENEDFLIFDYQGQQILKYIFPEEFSSCSATLFLRGPVTAGQKGDPDFMLEKIASNGMDIPPVVAPKQVHGTEVLEAEENISLPLRPEGDGVVVRGNGIRGSLRFADCFPVIIAFMDPEPGLMILHSGYKGTLRNIAGKSLAFLRELSGEQVIESCRAIIGPGIGSCCYSRNLSDPLAADGRKKFSCDFWKKDKNCIFFDISGIIKRQLADAGLCRSRVSIIPRCPSCMNETFYSYRKGDKYDRMFLVAGIKKSFCQKDSLWWENVL